jgi:hypothetical protein
MMPGKRAVYVAAILLIAGAAHRLVAAPTYNVGDKVEVREGDQWTPGAILAHEGRRYQVHYGTGADALDEWMTADRLKAFDGPEMPSPADNPSGGIPNFGVPDNLGGPIKTPGGTFTPGDEVEFADAMGWTHGRLVRFKGGLAVVEDNSDQHHQKWVQLFQLRNPNSTYEFPEHPWPEDYTDGKRPQMKPMSIDIYFKTDPFVQMKYGTTSAAKLITKDIYQDKAFIYMTYHDNDPLTFAEYPLPALAPDPLWTDAKASGEIIIRQGLGVIAPRPAPVRAGKNPALPPRPILAAPPTQVVSGVTDFFPKHSSVIFSQVDDLIPGSATPAVTLVRQDAQTREVGGAVPLPASLRLIAVAPDGKSILLGHPSEDPIFHKFDYLQIDDATGEIPQATQIFQPFHEGLDKIFHRPTKRTATQASFIDSNHIIVTGDFGTSVVWNLATHRQLYALDADGTNALSAGGKYLAVAMKARVVILDSLTGKPLAEIPTPTYGVSKMAFSPSGKSLLLVGNFEIERWDITSGKTTASFGIDQAGLGTLTFFSDNYAMIGNVVYDLNLGVPLVQYTDIASACQGAGAPLWVATGRTYRTLDLPDPVALKFAQTLNLDDVLLLKSGSKVSLSINVNGNDIEKKTAHDAIERAAQDNGWVIADNQPVQIVADTVDGPSHDVYYHSWDDMFGRNATKLSVPEKVSRLRIVYNGADLWKNESHSGPPMSLQMKKDQSIGDAINEANGWNFGIFESAAFPPTVLKPHTGGGLLVAQLANSQSN